MKNKKVFVVRYLIAILVAQIATVFNGLTGHFVFTAHWPQEAAAQSIIACLQLWMWLCWMPVSKDESLWMQEAFAGGMLWLVLVFCPASWLWFILSHFTSMPLWAAKLLSIGLAGAAGIGWFTFPHSKSSSVRLNQVGQVSTEEKRNTL